MASPTLPTHNTNRNSLGSIQLPLPNGLNAPPIQTPRSTPSSRPQPNSPVSAGFIIPPIPHVPVPPGNSYSSSTHAGGIQPSASFFRPSRPTTYRDYNAPALYNNDRPSSPSSAHGDVPLVVIDAERERDLMGGGVDWPQTAESIAGGTDQDHSSTLNQTQNQLYLKRMKQSREPLLPGPGPLSPHSPSTSTHYPGGAGTGGPMSPARSATRLVRTSLDRMFGLSRGMSFDSSRLAAKQQHSGFDDDDDLHHTHNRKPSHTTSHRPISSTSSNSNESSALDNHITSSSHPNPKFIPFPPPHSPPLRAIPVLHLNSPKPIRRYEQHPSRNRFFLSGRLLTGGDTPYAFIASFTLLLVIAGVWFGTTAVWWWRNESPAVAVVGGYMALLVISTMLTTASIDPGILPRNLDPDPPYPAISPGASTTSNPNAPPSATNHTPPLRAPMPRDLKVRSDVVRVKYCPTCQTYRPPRSSHCKMCDNCVDGCDHHCQWVNNCVGRRNYVCFFGLLGSATITLVLIIVTSALHLVIATHRMQWKFKDVLGTGEGIGSAVAFCLSIAVIWPVAALLSYHMRLLLLNITTIEQIRNQAHKTLIPGPPPPNPFSHGSWRRNLLAVLCRPRGYSYLDARGIVTEDKRDVNPGMVGMGIGMGGGGLGGRRMDDD